MGAVALFWHDSALLKFPLHAAGLYLGYDFYSGVLHVALDDRRTCKVFVAHSISGVLGISVTPRHPLRRGLEAVYLAADLNIIV